MIVILETKKILFHRSYVVKRYHRRSEGGGEGRLRTDGVLHTARTARRAVSTISLSAFLRV